jgi:hypothetical protein
MSDFVWPDETMWDRFGRPRFCLGPHCKARLPQPSGKRGRPRTYCSEACSNRAKHPLIVRCPTCKQAWVGCDGPHTKPSQLDLLAVAS